MLPSMRSKANIKVELETFAENRIASKRQNELVRLELLLGIFFSPISHALESSRAQK